jgi:hypothetical protein
LLKYPVKLECEHTLCNICIKSQLIKLNDLSYLFKCKQCSIETKFNNNDKLLANLNYLNNLFINDINDSKYNYN